jgi:DNA-binding MarR family transcriptional regulator
MSTRESKTLTPAPPPPAEGDLRELMRTLGLLVRLQESYFARFGLSGAQWGILRSLQRATQEGRTGLRLTDLSDRLLIRPPSVTGVVDRLERAGLVERKESRIDLRAKQVTLTERGRELVARVAAMHGVWADTVLNEFSADEMSEIRRLLDRFQHHLEELLSRGAAANFV